MLHPHTELRAIDDTIGFGVFATRDLPRGTITWARDALDQIVGPDVFRTLEAHARAAVEKYSWVDGDGDRVLCWDLGRFMNHHCGANTLSPGFAFDIALRDIAAGEEITTDYGSLNLDEPFSCACASPRCRGTVGPGDFDALAAGWDGRLRDAFALAGSVEQMLWGLIRDTDAVRAAIDDPARVPSILRHRWTGAAQSVARRRPNR
jgi:hypothetical protein